MRTDLTVLVVVFFKTFAANNDEDGIVKYDLIPPVTAKYIRIIPESWHDCIALRVEFYGCSASKNPLCCFFSYKRGVNPLCTNSLSLPFVPN